MFAHPEPIENALRQTDETRDKLVSGAQELQVTNAVLQQEIPEAKRTEEIALAIEKNEALETRVQECADDLGEVRQALSAEVARRKRLETTLEDAGIEPPKDPA